MKYSSFLVLLIGAILGFITFDPGVSAHSWEELSYVINSNGTFTGQPGYPRGYGKT
jgi:hypothetical protein